MTISLIIVKDVIIIENQGVNFITGGPPLRGLSQITFALGVGTWSEKRVVCYIKSAN
jgi:hypothetical protein